MPVCVCACVCVWLPSLSDRDDQTGTIIRMVPVWVVPSSLIILSLMKKMSSHDIMLAIVEKLMGMKRDVSENA